MLTKSNFNNIQDINDSYKDELLTLLSRKDLNLSDKLYNLTIFPGYWSSKQRIVILYDEVEKLILCEVESIDNEQTTAKIKKAKLEQLFNILVTYADKFMYMPSYFRIIERIMEEDFYYEQLLQLILNKPCIYAEKVLVKILDYKIKNGDMQALFYELVKYQYKFQTKLNSIMKYIVNVIDFLFSFGVVEDQYQQRNVLILYNSIEKAWWSNLLVRKLYALDLSTGLIIQIVDKEDGIYYNEGCLDPNQNDMLQINPLTVIKIQLKKIRHDNLPNIYLFNHSEICVLGKTRLCKMFDKFGDPSCFFENNKGKRSFYSYGRKCVSEFSDLLNYNIKFENKYMPIYLVNFTGSQIKRYQGKHGVKYQLKMTGKKFIDIKVEGIEKEKDMYYIGLALIECYKDKREVNQYKVIKLYGRIFTEEEFNKRKEKHLYKYYSSDCDSELSDNEENHIVGLSCNDDSDEYIDIDEEEMNYNNNEDDFMNEDCWNEYSETHEDEYLDYAYSEGAISNYNELDDEYNSTIDYSEIEEMENVVYEEDMNNQKTREEILKSNKEILKAMERYKMYKVVDEEDDRFAINFDQVEFQNFEGKFKNYKERYRRYL